MSKYMKYIIPVIIIAVGVVLMLFLSSLKKKTLKQDPVVASKIVVTEEVKLHPVASHINLFGRAATSEPVMLNSEVNGVLEKGDIDFKVSQKFFKGDLICKIDDRQAKYSLNSAKSDLLNALANVLPEIKVNFENEYTVWQEYFNNCKFDSKITPLPEVTNEKIHLYLSRFNVYKFYYNALSLEIILDKHYFYAPFDGSIIKTNLQVGSSVRIGEQIGEIINTADMEISVPVETKNILWIDKDKNVTIKSKEFSREWSGKISRIGSNIDTRTQTVNLFIKVNQEKNNPLLNGVFVEVEFQGKLVENAFAIPPMALYEESYVYLVKDGRLQKQSVRLVRRESDRVIITDGIKTGDIIVVEALQGVASGMPARSKTNMSGDY